MERVRKADVAAVLKAKIQPFWNTLVTDLKEAARRFNEEFPERERQIDQVELKEQTVMLIRRTNYPAVLLLKREAAKPQASIRPETMCLRTRSRSVRPRIFHKKDFCR